MIEESLEDMIIEVDGYLAVQAMSATTQALVPEVLATAFKYYRENPNETLRDAIVFGLVEWDLLEILKK